MNEIDFLKHRIVLDTVAGIKSNKLLKDQAEYNLFTLSSYNAYLENFHTDVIASFLNPKGLHQEGDKFILLFIKFLNSKYDLAINADDFHNATVLREVGTTESHIDILIAGQSEAIIVENKINNADDMQNQIDRYYDIGINRGYKVKGIVYLTLEGVKQAPKPIRKDAAEITKSIGAFSNLSNDLVEGWLFPCLTLCTNEDSKSLIFQYIKLIKHLAHKNMDTTIKENFYQFISDNDYLKNTPALINLINGIPAYRADKLVKALTDYSPFRKYFRWKDNYPLYQDYFDGGFMYKLDFRFNSDGSVFMWFWIPEHEDEIGKNIVLSKLQSIGLENEFIEDRGGYIKTFNLDGNICTIADIDEAILLFTNKLLAKLRS